MVKGLFRRALPIALLLGLTVARVWVAANRQVLWAAAVGPGLARFEPGGEAWELEFWIVGDGWGERMALLRTRRSGSSTSRG